MNLITLEDEKFKDVKVSGYNFKIRYITPLDRIKISQRRMTLQAGYPVESLTQGEFDYFENIAMNDICIDESPKDFKSNESCVNWDSIDLINEIAGEIRQHTADIEEKLKKNKPID